MPPNQFPELSPSGGNQYLGDSLTLWLPFCKNLTSEVNKSAISRQELLEWVAIPFSRAPSLGLLHCREIPYHLSHQGSPILPQR